MYDLIVIGGGPAGLTATVYALRKRLNVLLITRDMGGKTNFRLQVPDLEHHLVIDGDEIVSRFVNEIEYLDFARLLDRVTSLEPSEHGYAVTTAGGRRFTARAIIIASGSRPQRLTVPGEREFEMRGLCYSAVSYAPLFMDRSTVVIGDSGLALRAAAELARLGRMVTLVAPGRGQLDSPLGLRLAASANVTILENCQVLRVNGDQYARSLTVSYQGRELELSADAFFVELGLLPATDFAAGVLERDAQGRIAIDQRNRTSAAGIFAAGDVTDLYAEQVLIAIGEGARAALSAYEYLLEQPVPAPAVAATEWR
jgi:NADH-dependent peroxiredoxin subunit F